MNLKDYVLTYEKDGKVVANLFDYYETFVKPLDNRFSEQSYDNRLVLCFFKDHADINPSMGYIKDKQHKGNFRYHCFGCGKTGDVVRLNQYIESAYHNRELTEDESTRDLALKFGIDISEFDELEDEDYEKRYMRNLKRTEQLQRKYTITEYKQGIMQQRLNGVDLDKVNFECIKMIATVKQLYS